jgi:hypothetical protein
LLLQLLFCNCCCNCCFAFVVAIVVATLVFAIIVYNTCKTTIEKQQLLKQILETARGTPPGQRKKNIKKMQLM